MRRRDLAGAAQQGAVEAAQGVAAGPAQAHAALGGAGDPEPGTDAAPPQVRLGGPLRAAHREAADDGQGQRRPTPPGGYEGAARQQRQGEPHPVRRTEHRGGGDPEAQAREGPARGPGSRPAQEPADGGHGGQRHPQVRHRLRPVQHGDPQPAEQRGRQRHPAGPQQRPPHPERRVQRPGGQQRQHGPERGGGAGHGEDGGGEQADAARARGAEVRGRTARVELGDVHGLVPAQAEVRDDEGQLQDRVADGDQREPDVRPGVSAVLRDAGGPGGGGVGGGRGHVVPSLLSGFTGCRALLRPPVCGAPPGAPCPAAGSGPAGHGTGSGWWRAGGSGRVRPGCRPVRRRAARSGG